MKTRLINRIINTGRMQILASLLFWSVLSGPAVAQLLSYDDIVNRISGEWAVPFEEDGRIIRDCARLTVSIWIEEEPVGRVYYSQFYSDEHGEGLLHRSSLRQATGADNRLIPAVLIKYDNEERATDSGALVEWRLYMTADDTFSWQATHWAWDAWTPHRTRCETNSDIS